MPHSAQSVLLAALAATSLSAVPAQAQRVDRIVAFGDSYADDGNLFEILGFNPAPQVYPTGRFSGGTNYIDTLSQLLNAPVANFAIGGALADNSNTNGPGLPGFTTEWMAFLGGGGGPFPAVSGTFSQGDLVTVSIGGNDARFYQQNGGTQAGAAAAAAGSVVAATAGLDALVAAGAPTISFLAGNTAILPEIAGNAGAQATRNAYSTAFNSGIQASLAGYASDGVIVHYLDLTAIGDRIAANPTAYGLTSAGACAPAPQCIGDSSYANRFLFYVDNLHLTSAGFAIVGRYVAAQLQAPLTLGAPGEAALDNAMQFARVLHRRMDLQAPRDGGLAEGVQLFASFDTAGRDVHSSASRDAFDIDTRGVTAGLTYGMGNKSIGIAARFSRPESRFGAGVARSKSQSWQIGGFAGMTLFGAFAQATIGFGRDDHDLDRAGVVDGLDASADGHHAFAGAKAGYLMPLGVMRAGPVVALDYARAKVDSYAERGDPALALNVSSQKAEALTAALGAELRGDFDGGGVTLRPFASAMLETDLIGDGDVMAFAQQSAPGIVNRWPGTDRSKSVHGRVAAGASAAIFDRVTLDALASTTIGRDSGEEVGAQVGLRLGF